jgi:adenosine deaminase CECR1
MQWAAFDDQNDDQWLRILESGDTGESLNGKRMREWAQDWEKFCIWVVEEFGPTSGCKTEVSGGL